MQRYFPLLKATVVIALLNLHATALANYAPLTVLGTLDAVCIGGVTSKKHFQNWTAANTSTVRAVMQNASWPGNTDELLRLIAAGEFVEKRYYPGTNFEWLSSLNNNKPVALPNRMWAGSDAFTGYEITISTDKGKDTIVVPKVCCNFALLSQGVPVAVKPPTDLPPPVVSAVAKTGLLSSLKPFVRLTLGTESTVYPKTVNQVNCEKCNQPVKPVDPYNPQKPAQAIDNDDLLTASSGTDALATAGARFGAELPLNKTLSFLTSVGMVGRTATVTGNNYPEIALHLDLELRKKFSDFWFISGGVGRWNLGDNEHSTTSTFIATGSKLTEHLGWFIEQRQFSDQPNGAENAISAGISLQK